MSITDSIPPVVVCVAMPLIGRDAHLVPDWAAAIDEVARVHPLAIFLKCAAVRVGDEPAQQACTLAGVETVAVPWYEIAEPQGARSRNAAGVMLKRIRLVRHGVELGAAVMWFVDADVRPAPEHWGALDALFRAGKPVALIPYPARWAEGAPAVCLAVSGQILLWDARLLHSSEGAASAVIAGGKFGCTAILTSVAALIPFQVPQLVLSSGGAVAGEDVGWFVNAAQAGVEVRMPLGLVAEHVGCPVRPLVNTGALCGEPGHRAGS
jgi:hypothetical protein